MTERERWVVYPLLFLALGASLRDKLIDRTTARSIICQELIVVDAEPLAGGDDRVLARIGRTEPTPGTPPVGFLFVNGHVEVQGALNAGQYAYQGVPFMPAFQSVFPGLPLPAEWLRALQQQREAQRSPPPDAPQQNETDQPPEPLADPTDSG